MRHLQHLAPRFFNVTVWVVDHRGLYVGEHFGGLFVGISFFQTLDVETDFAFEVAVLGLIQPTHLIDELFERFLLFHDKPPGFLQLSEFLATAQAPRFLTKHVGTREGKP